MSLSPHAADAIAALCLGFALAGLCASAYEWITLRPIGLAALQRGGAGSYLAVPVLVLSAPLLIIRAILRLPPRSRPTALGTAAATILAGGWSLMSGRLALDLTRLAIGA